MDNRILSFQQMVKIFGYIIPNATFKCLVLLKFMYG